MSAPRIPVYRPWLSGGEEAALSRVLKSGWFTQGPEIAAFEKEFADYVSAPFACAVSNGTTALDLALRVAGVVVGDEVILPSHSFIACANSVRALGALPVFVDIELSTYNMDPVEAERAITPKTRAILTVHQLGMPSDLVRLVSLSKSRGIPLIEDAACAIGSEIQDAKGGWERIGKPHGDFVTFSFHPRKLLTTGEGGMITSSNPSQDARLRLLRQHGMDAGDLTRHVSAKVMDERYVEPGFNHRMSDLEGAMGRAQLSALPRVLEKRRAQVARYISRLSKLSGMGIPKQPEWARSNWQSFCVLLPKGMDVKKFRQSALDEGIATRRAVMNAHQEPAYPASSYRAGSLRASEEARERGVILPLYDALTDAEQEEVISFVEKEVAR